MLVLTLISPDPANVDSHLLANCGFIATATCETGGLDAKGDAPPEEQKKQQKAKVRCHLPAQREPCMDFAAPLSSQKLPQRSAEIGKKKKKKTD